MEKIKIGYEVEEVLSEQTWDEDDEGFHDSNWEEYDTIFAGKVVVSIGEDWNLDELIENLRIALVEANYVNEDVARRASISTKDGGLSFCVDDWDWKPLYKLTTV